MKRKILQSLILMIVIGIVVSSVLYFNTLYQSNLDKEKSYLSEAANSFKSWADLGESEIVFEDIFKDLNISKNVYYFYLSEEGNIIYGEEELLDDLQLDAKSISQILNGTKSLVLYNRNKGRDYLIEARELMGGNYVVVSKLIDNPFEVFKKTLPGIWGLLIIGIFISLFISERTVDDFMGTIEEQARDITGDYGDINTKYKELYPFIRIIRDQKENINHHIMQMEHQGGTLETIISNMKEGMILLDTNMDILTINESAIKLGDINYYGVNYNGVNLKGLFRSNDLNEVFNKVAKEPNKSHSYDISLNNKIINVLVSPVLNVDSNIGFVIFLVDETKQKLIEAKRKEFSANVSHELKTPLTSINGYAEMMMNGFVKEEDMLRFSEIIYNEGQNLLHMIDDIIKISKLDEGDSSLELEEINFNEIVEEIVKTLDYKIEEKNINIFLDLIANKTFKYNKQILKELFMNLIDNGIKYNNYGGKLFISQREITPHTMEIKIRDTGIGISDEDQERIFERFYTVDKSHNKKDSSGLGLSIVKHIVKLLGGSIQLDSQLGRGSEFTVMLPIIND